MDIRFTFPGVVFAVMLLLCSPSFSSGRAVYYTADSMNVEFDTFGEAEKLVLSGNVRISLEEVNLACGKAVFNKVSGEIEASEGIEAETLEGKFTAERLSYNVYEGRGVLFNASFSAPPLYGRAEKIEREKETLILHNGYVTTCDRPEPHYRFSVDRLTYVYGEYLRAERMRFFLGKNVSIFYFPRITIDQKTGEPPLAVSSSSSARLGETFDMSFQHRVSRDGSLILKERLSLGNEAFGVGAGIRSVKNNLDVSAFLAHRWDGSDWQGGGWAGLISPIPFFGSQGRLVVDWRWMDDNEFFYDFFRDLYSEKFRSYNHFSVTSLLGENIFNIGIRENAGDPFLGIEKMPEIRFFTPEHRVPRLPVFFENDLRITNFRKEGEYWQRSMDTARISARKKAGRLLLSPYLSLTGADYRNSGDSIFNFRGESGASASMLLRRNEGDFTGYIRPSLSIFRRDSKYDPGELEPFDREETLDDGTFAALGMSWSSWEKDSCLGSVSMDSVYSLDDGRFRETILRYSLRIGERITVSGDNEWDFGSEGSSFGVNDIIYESGRYRFNLGTRYDDQGDVFGLAAGFRHDVNSMWRYSMKLFYDVEENSFNRQSLDIRRKLHCWELNLRIDRDDDGFSFYIFAYPVFI